MWGGFGGEEDRGGEKKRVVVVEVQVMMWFVVATSTRGFDAVMGAGWRSHVKVGLLQCTI